MILFSDLCYHIGHLLGRTTDILIECTLALMPADAHQLRNRETIAQIEVGNTTTTGRMGRYHLVTMFDNITLLVTHEMCTSQALSLLLTLGDGGTHSLTQRRHIA